MGKNFKRKIVFSEKLKKTNDGKALQDYSDDLTKPSAKFRIVHFFDADCSTCVEDLKKIQEKIVKSKSTERLKYVFIGSSISEGNFENILTESDLQIPVYFQKGNLEFKRQNQLPLTDNVYNTILINDENQMLLFGSYFDSELAHDLATKLMNCL